MKYFSFMSLLKLACIVLLYSITSIAQPSLFGIKNYSNHYEFISINTGTDSITVLNRIPFNYYAMNFSACYDPINQKYYYCSGQILLIIDASTGLIDDSLNFEFINPFYFNSIAYNPANGRIYGIKYNIVTQVSFFSYLDTAALQIVDVGPLPLYFQSTNTAKSIIAADRQLYVIQSTILTGIDINSGQILFSDSIPVTTNQSFDHIAFSCKTGKIYGLWNEPSIPEEYFGIIDSNAYISLVNPSPLPVFFYKSLVSGSAIDNNSDIYYYAALQGKLYGINIHTGNLVYSHDYGPGFEFLFLQAASAYACPIAQIIDTVHENRIHLHPNPVTETLTILNPHKYSDASQLALFNSEGKKILQIDIPQNSTEVELSIEDLANGIYLVHLACGNYIFTSKIIVAKQND